MSRVYILTYAMKRGIQAEADTGMDDVKRTILSIDEREEEWYSGFCDMYDYNRNTSSTGTDTDRVTDIVTTQTKNKNPSNE